MTKQGQSTMDDFMAHVENKAQKRAHLEQLTTRTLESEDISEKSPLEDLESDSDLDTDTEAFPVLFERMGQVCHSRILMH